MPMRASVYVCQKAQKTIVSLINEVPQKTRFDI